MGKHLALSLLFIVGIGFSNSKAQTTQPSDSLGLPGDNLNLYAVMKLFQSSPTLEEFERKLNEEDSKINNLDLNNDNKVDYIRVVDNVDKNVHNIVLQVPINEKENQDVATFIVEKKQNGDVDIQLIGDEDLYGKDYIIEPEKENIADKKETPNPGYIKQSTTTQIDSKGNTTIINNYNSVPTASWPVISYMYMPSYVVWVSPWRWLYYPVYWTPWTPWYWHRYYGYHYNFGYYYYRNYRYCHSYRNPFAYQNYYLRRNTSVVININLKSGAYRKAYDHPESKSSGRREYYRGLHTQKRDYRDNNQNNSIRRTEVKRDVEKDIYKPSRQTREKNSSSIESRNFPPKSFEQHSNSERRGMERQNYSRDPGRGGNGRRKP